MTDIVKRLRNGPDGLGNLCDDAVDAANKIERLRAALRYVENWDHRGDTVSEAYDDTHGAGSWAALLGA